MCRHGLVGIAYPAKEGVARFSRFVYILGNSLSVSNLGSMYQLLAYIIVYLIYIDGVCSLVSYIIGRNGLCNLAPSIKGIALFLGSFGSNDCGTILKRISNYYLVTVKVTRYLLMVKVPLIVTSFAGIVSGASLHPLKVCPSLVGEIRCTGTPEAMLSIAKI